MKYVLLIVFMVTTVFANDDAYSSAKKAEKEKDYIQAEKFYRKACDAGDDKSCLGLVNLYFNGKGKQGNMVVAYKLSKMLCNKGNAEGCFFLGYMYSEGKGIDKNVELATKTLKQACELKEDKACYNLANRYLKEKKYTNAIEYYEKSLLLGNYSAGTVLSSIYFSGTGVAKNMDKAVKYSKDACEKGKLTTSCAFLGTYYIQTNNYKEGKKYSEKACKMKPDAGIKDSKKIVAEACANTGLIYAKGFGVELSMYKARKYFRKACDMGLDTACKYYNKTLQY